MAHDDVGWKTQGVTGDHGATAQALQRENEARLRLLAEELPARRVVEEALRESEACLRLALESASMGIWSLDLASGEISWSATAGAIFGLPPAFTSASIAECLALVHPADRHQAIELLQNDQVRSSAQEVELRIVGPDGVMHWVAARGDVVRDAAGAVTRITGTVTIITERKESEERYRRAVQAGNVGVWDWDLTTNAIYLDPQLKTMLGYADDEIHNHLDDWVRFVHPDDMPAVMERAQAHLDGLAPVYEVEHRMLHRDGSSRWVLARGTVVRNEAGRPVRMLGTDTDMTELKLAQLEIQRLKDELEERVRQRTSELEAAYKALEREADERRQAQDQLMHDALHDTLTGLPNRILFMDRLLQADRRTQRDQSYQFAVLFLDLDRFKIINDSLGHIMGDKLLVAIGRRIEATLRLIDTVARFGGDEFVMLLEDCGGVQEAQEAAQRLQEAFTRPIFLDDHEIFATISIGIAHSASGYTVVEDLLRNADLALYKAKGSGRACFQVFDSSMHTQASQLLRIETELRRGIERGELRLFYQPIVSLASGAIIGFEALVRWQHPESGLLGPAEFIPTAEETGLIAPIGWWTLNEACRQLGIWQRQHQRHPALTMHVNMSARQFTHPDLLHWVKQTMAEHYVDPTCLVLEITEGTMMESVSLTRTTLEHLRELGVKVSIDDFGTGYSSLSYLHRFQINTLKIDRSFVHGMAVQEEHREIVRTIVTLAHTLGLDVIAEGAETPEQIAELRALECEYGQGFVFSRPIPSGEVELLLRGDQSLLPHRTLVRAHTGPLCEPSSLDTVAQHGVP